MKAPHGMYSYSALEVAANSITLYNINKKRDLVTSRGSASMALKSIILPTGSVKYWSKQHHRTNKQGPELGRLNAIRCINTRQLQPNWRGYLQLHDKILTIIIILAAFCVLLMTALLWIPRHIIWKHHRGTQVFSKD